MKKWTLFFFLLFSISFCFAQNKPKDWYIVEGIDLEKISTADAHLLDSFLLLYHQTTIDTIKLAYLGQIVEGLDDDNIWPLYNEVMLEQSQNKSAKIYVKYYSAALNNVGYISSRKADISLAISSFNKSLQLRQDIDDKQGIEECLHNIGLLYKDRGDNAKALEYLLRALEIEKALNDKVVISSTLNNIGGIYLEQLKFKRALEVLSQSLEIAEETKNKKLIAGSYSALGDAYASFGENEKAIECYNFSIKNAEETADKSRLASAYTGISKLYLTQSNFALSEKYALLALNIGNKLKYPRIIRNSTELLYKTYKKLGSFEKALPMHELFTQMSDSINNSETSKILANVEFNAKETELKVEHEKKTAIAATESKRQKTILWSVSGILALVLVLAIFVLRSNNQKKKANILISKQKEEVEQHQKEIIDSINYAKRIQQAIFKDEEYVSKHLPPHFILFKPKDIVSGDFYWAFEKGDYFYFAAGDCTGHGVPGAFLTMLGISFLNEVNAKEEILNPAEILNQLRDKVIKELGRQGQTKDGMDISLTRINLKTKELMWAGANNPLWYMNNDILKEIKADKQPIGYSEKTAPFTNHSVSLNSMDTFYLFTDGFADQFGGIKGKKYKYKQLKELLLSNCHLPLQEQKEILNKNFEAWKGELEQVDDVVVIGIRLA
jgi:serine phosphatase RsbU (regulator of sigma subunit)